MILLAVCIFYKMQSGHHHRQFYKIISLSRQRVAYFIPIKKNGNGFHPTYLNIKIYLFKLTLTNLFNNQFLFQIKRFTTNFVVLISTYIDGHLYRRIANKRKQPAYYKLVNNECK